MREVTLARAYRPLSELCTKAADLGQVVDPHRTHFTEVPHFDWIRCNAPSSKQRQWLTMTHASTLFPAW